ncbi:GAF and ANTAR domain-containing protein [Saccharothrix algeriensis]|uniref:GAF and ANTAR domain-containing protein n=1 Tax=Saccharothrix algeriensis TaxID=173560 RepID=A0A8T8HY61_9PSEU|nr:GAF and ANTAR domain-containing protein [Saccharothrix algeriensis]MBM7815097.1 GAF domain-containing protein [Saccharothrix algeriensis]QTR03347.1 GAF and ANTAR domain-containing protein [Saccharothrix algeriensis]
MTHDSTDAVLSLAGELAEMSRLIEDEDYEATAHRFVDRVVHAVSGCDVAWISVGRGEGVEVVAASGAPPVNPADTSPEGAGPIAEVLRYREPRRLEDTRVDRRWPLFASRLALRDYRSCLTLPVPTERSHSAALTLLSRTPHRFDEHAYDIVLLVTLHAGIALDNAEVFLDGRRMVQNLTTALGTRHAIGVAQGLLMHRFGCDTSGGFDLLRRASQHSNRKLRDIAADLVAAHEQGDLDAALRKHHIGADDRSA